jgi:hypothetical protein
MVCLRNISVDTLHKGDTKDNNNNNNNNNVIKIIITTTITKNRESYPKISKLTAEDKLSRLSFHVHFCTSVRVNAHGRFSGRAEIRQRRLNNREYLLGEHKSGKKSLAYVSP